MKTLLFLLLILFANGTNAQNKDIPILLCDSIILIDGSVKLLQIKEIKRKKIVYILCCDKCAVPREMKRSDVETIFHNQERIIIEEKKIAEQENKFQGIEDNTLANDSIAFLLYTKTNSILYRSRKMRDYSKAIIWTRDSVKIKGFFHIINLDSISINNDTIALDDIRSITKPNIVAKYVGNSIGIGLLALELATAKNSIFWGVLTVGSVPFFAMNTIRKKFNLKDKWEVEVKYEVLRKD